MTDGHSPSSKPELVVMERKRPSRILKSKERSEGREI
jgi:hypothetical protein